MYEGTVRRPDDLGLALQQARKAAGLSQRELAARMGITQRYVSEMESGRPVAAVARLVEALHEVGAVLTVAIPEGDDTDG